MSKHNLRYDVRGAYEATEYQRPAMVVKALGITYDKWIPQTIGDQIWLIGAVVPENVALPSYIEPLALDPEQERYWLTDGKEGRP